MHWEKKPGILFSDQNVYGKYMKSEDNEDLSPELPEPDYYPDFEFIHGVAPIPHETKNFGKLKHCKITVGCVCVWKHSHMFDVYKIQPLTPESVPYYMRKKYY